MKFRKTVTTALTALTLSLACSGYSSGSFKLSDLKDYHKEYKSVSVGACSSSSIKTYEDYRAITNTASTQYHIIHEQMKVDATTGFLLDKDGFIGVAMGYAFGDLGSRYYVELDSGSVIPVIKVDAKSSAHAADGCSAMDGSVIEFVIDSDIASDYFGGTNGLAASGNFNNYKYLEGNIVDIEKVTSEPLETGIIYEESVKEASFKADGFGDQISLIMSGY